MNEETKTLTYEKTQRITFTTHRKKPKSSIDISRKGSIVKERCKQLTELIAELFPDRVLSGDDLICLIQDYIGADKETLRAYKGYSGHVRAGRCGDNRIVGLSRKGYLEQFGFLKKIHGYRWMICQTVLSPQDMTVGLESKEKISLSPIEAINSWKGTEGKLGTVSPLVISNREAANRELEEEEDTEKERNFTPKIIGEPSISTPLKIENCLRRIEKTLTCQKCGKSTNYVLSLDKITPAHLLGLMDRSVVGKELHRGMCPDCFKKEFPNDEIIDNVPTLTLNPLEQSILHASPYEEPDRAKTNLGGR